MLYSILKNSQETRTGFNMKKFNTGRCFIADRTKPYQVNHPSYGDLVYDTENNVLAVATRIKLTIK